MDLVRDTAIGVEFEIDPRFVRIDSLPPADTPGGNGDARAAGEAAAGGASHPPDLPTAHFIASDPAAGWIAALALVTVACEPQSPERWLAEQLARAQASFAQWSPASHDMLVPPEAADLAGRPAIHVSYRLKEQAPAASAAEPVAAEGPALPSFVEHWTVLVAERSWLLAMELMVQPSYRWDEERVALELPFRTLRLF